MQAVQVLIWTACFHFSGTLLASVRANPALSGAPAKLLS
jgi:hypothetical protein